MTTPCDAVLLDIEGTTTSVSFVYDVLFPYARREVAAFLAARWDDPHVQHDVDLLRAQAVADADEGAPPIPPAEAGEAAVRAATLANVLWQMDRDRKTTGLKALQGRIWASGYASGALEGHVYPDVPGALRAWREAGIPVAIYSSGSVAAQRLLFAHSEAGDLTPLLAAHFDTTTGPKREPASYLAIADALGVAPGRLLFVTDVLAEARAAEAAGLPVALSVRPGNAPLDAHPYREVRALTDLLA